MRFGPDSSLPAGRGDVVILDRRDVFIVRRTILGFYAVDAIALPAFVADRLHMALLALTTFVGAEPQLELWSAAGVIWMQAGLMALCSGPDSSFLAARGDVVILDRRDVSIVCGNTLGSYAVDAIAVAAFVADCLDMASLAVLTPSYLVVFKMPT